MPACRTAAAFAALLLLLPPADAAFSQPARSEAPSGLYRADPTHTSITWRLNHWGLSNYTARFVGYAATLQFDASQPERSRLEVSIDPLSVRTDFVGPKDWDAEVARDPQFLNGGTHPRITYVSRSIVSTGDRTARVEGDLTLLGITRPVAMEVRFNGSYADYPIERVPALGFSGRATFNRSDFGMTALLPSIGDAIEVIVEAEFHGRR
ncbi:YceI family protein [Leptolyngbya sp. 15MV]|nr:YceI family protein [Leptolyngbya sp. 15MV]